MFNDRGELPLQRARSATRARPGVVNGLGVWWRKLGRDGTNVNELTHQRLTDIGRAPTFYDCLVEVAPATARRDAAAPRAVCADGRGGAALARRRCWPPARCA
ncbi:MAG: hypothetical protein MZW92_63125 [Comamonadaceae bacterium]|nr:hypothetical protein [Comamonadaceae bacterium]